jgi:hypothetical protein
METLCEIKKKGIHMSVSFSSRFDFQSLEEAENILESYCLSLSSQGNLFVKKDWKLFDICRISSWEAFEERTLPKQLLFKFLSSKIESSVFFAILFRLQGEWMVSSCG